MTKIVKYTAICKEWKLISLHLLRPWSTCKVWISYADISSAVWHELYDHPNNLQTESDALSASGLVVTGFLLWEEGSGKQDLRVVGWWGEAFFVRFLRDNVLIQVLRWRAWGELRMLSLLSKNLVSLILSLEQRWLFPPVGFFYLIVL